ncbi:MAG: YraN family protein [Bacteroidota bacterium]
MNPNHQLGKQGEQLAVDMLVDKGYTIKQRNYRYQKAEIDIIAQKQEIIAIVEVKSRSSEYWEEIAETVNQKKISLLVMAANQYVIDQELDVEIRFDIITVLQKGQKYQLEHLEDAYFHF